MLVDESTLTLVVGLFVFLFGACIGSFLNVVAYRLPLEISVMFPGSHCTSCKTPVPAYGLIPVLGYFLVRGRCVACKSRISAVYPLVEILVGLGTVFLFFHFLTAEQLLYNLTGSSLDSGPALGRLRYQNYLAFFSSLWLFYTAVPLVIIDLRYRLLLDVITLPGTLVAFVLASLNPNMGWAQSLLGIVAGAGGLYVVAKVYELVRKREGMGMGDVKYLALIGATVGWQGVIWVVALASLLGAFVGIVYGLVRREGLSAAIPFGPFLAAAALAVNLFGRQIEILIYGA